jgi:peptidoglycan/xylan/chitin deacetylase (PgdA/CDA1 family)
MPGNVTLSIELELGWGMHDVSEYGHLSPERSTESATLNWLLGLCNEYKIPISFDVVGHLLLDECTGNHGGSHPRNWWSADPGTNADEDPLFYAPEMISKVAEQPVDHEICTHTFSHILAGEMDDEVLADELRMSREVFANAGYAEPVSIVLPRHQPASSTVLQENGIKTIRTPFEWSGRFGKLKNCGRWLLRHPVGRPKKEDDLVRTFCTPFPSLTSIWLPQGNGVQPPLPAQSLPLAARKRWHEWYLTSAIDRAADRKMSVHLWSHLLNINNQAQRAPISACIEYMASRRDEGAVEIRRMCDLPGAV